MTESSTAGWGTAECLLLARAVQHLQGCGVDPHLLPAASHQKKEKKNRDPNNCSPKLFQSLGEGAEAHHMLTDTSELSITFHGSRDGSIITLSLVLPNASAEPPVFQHVNFNTVCPPYLPIFRVYFLKCRLKKS